MTTRDTGTVAVSAHLMDGASASAEVRVVRNSPASCGPVTDQKARPTTAMGRPPYLVPVTEPDFKTRLVRITGDPGTPIPVVGGQWGQISGHGYAKEQVWNADQSLMILRVVQGLGAYLFLDGRSYQPVFKRTDVPGVEVRWHPTLPDVMAYVEADGSAGFWNVQTQGVTRRFSAPAGAYSGASLGSGEGNLSRDGRWVAVLATRVRDGQRVAYVVDLETGTKGEDIELAAAGVSDADWVSVSQLGGYVVVDGVIDGAAQRVKVWSRATLTQTAYWPTHPLGHFDLGVTAAGREVAFGGDAGSINPTQFVALDLGSGAVMPLSPRTSWNWHASTRNVLRPGWGVGVTNDFTAFALSGEIYAVKLDGSQAVERYGRHRSANTDYEAAPFASPSPDGKRVIFRSNWGSSTGRPVAAYVLDTRSVCP